MRQVMIAGAGPTGMMLACELRRAGVSVRLVDRADRRRPGSRTAGIHPRTLEVFDQRGMVEEFLAAGRPIFAPHFAGIAVDWSTLPTRYPYMFGLLQYMTEAILERCTERMGVNIEWSTEVVGLDQDSEGVTVALRGPHGTVNERLPYLVGCDGARSVVRRLSDIPFDGSDGDSVTLLGDLEVGETPPGWQIVQRRPAGVFSTMPLGGMVGQSWWRVMVAEYGDEQPDEPMTLSRLREALIRVAGSDFGVHTPIWLSSFRDARRQARQYRSGRVLLAGDAAHIHPPTGAQGMNLGIQDAVNLGWKLASVVDGHASEALLDTYHQERHAVASDVLANTRAQAALLGPGDDVTAMRSQLASLLCGAQANEQLAAAMSGMNVCYVHDAPNPLIGRRIPDAEVITQKGTVRMFSLLHTQRTVLLDFENLPERATAASETIDYVGAQKTVRQWRLPVVGWVDVPSALLVRPDGHVAWVSSDTDSHGLTEALDALKGSTYAFSTTAGRPNTQ
jgi:2-polyprenyl-6-methoxyphenol hydroxylase-like FAD-dependent oxidoreductase